MADELSTAAEVIPGRFYFSCLRSANGLRSSHIASSSITFSIDDELLFEPFFADFGPLNLGKAYRYIKKAQDLLMEADRTKKRLYHVCGPHANQKANAAVLVGMFQVLFLNRSADDAMRIINSHKPFIPFRDASCGVSSFHLTVHDCLRGIQKARDVGFIDWNSGSSTWSIDEYEHFEQVENGDLNWIVPGKFLAFSGPAQRSNEVPGYRLFTPEDYWPYYRARNVGAVVRLNKRAYDAKRFKDGGIRHYELYFPDGSCPSEAIILRFLEIAEAEPGALAVHCKAGLGRTGVLICAYMMKHYHFTAEECLGYIRIARPGSVIGPQQNFLRDIEARMWAEGEAMTRAGPASRSRAAGADVGLGASDMGIKGKAVNEPHAPATPARSSYLAAQSPVGTQPSQQHGNSSSGVADAADMSLLQALRGGLFGGSSRQGAGGIAGVAGRLGGPAGYSSAASRDSTPSRESTSLRHSGGSVPASPKVASSYGSRGGTAGLSSLSGLGSHLAGAYSSIGSRGAGSPFSGLANRPPTLSTSLMSTPASTPPHSPGHAVVTAVSRSTGALPRRSDGAGNSGGGHMGGAAELRATLHTSTLQAADRPRANVERNLQSADMTRSSAGGYGGFSTRAGSAGSAAYTASGAPPSLSISPMGANGGAGTGTHMRVARTLAPNGQPRKVPVALLHQYRQAGLAAGARGTTPNLAQLAAGVQSLGLMNMAHSGPLPLPRS